MQQGLRIRLLGEVADRSPEEEIRSENRDAGKRLGIVLQRFRKVDNERDERRNEQDQGKRWKDALDPPLVEVADRIGAFIERSKEDSGDEEA